MNIKERFARWFIEKYLPDTHLHANPKVKKERPPLQSREEYMAWRKKIKGPPDPKEFESHDEYYHELQKYQMMMEARAEGDR